MPLSQQEKDRRVAAGKCEQCGTNDKEGDTRKCRACKEKNSTSRMQAKQRKIDRGICIKEGCNNPAKEDCIMCQSCISASSAGTNEHYHKKKDAGFCPYCPYGTPCEPGRRACRKHLDRLNYEGQASYAACKIAGICYFCPRPKKSALPGTAHCQEHKNENLVRSRRVHANRRKRVLDHYGRKCACCGLTLEAALQIDHIGGGGTKHLREIGRSGLYRWLIKNNFPDGFQTLCVLCNWLKRNYGACVHATLPYEAMELTREYHKKLDRLLREQR
jgi:hypothetical protein